MKPSGPFSSSQLSGPDTIAPGSEKVLPDDEANRSRRVTLNTNSAKSPRSVHFNAPAKKGGEEKGTRCSNAISTSGSFLVADHDVGGLLPHVASPQQRQEEFPPFQLTREDVEAAFEFLDVNGSGVLTMASLKQRLSAFYPQMTSKECKFLIEDPSGSNSGGGGNLAGNTDLSTTSKGVASPFSMDGPKTDGAHSHSTSANAPSAKSTANESFGVSNNSAAHVERLTSAGEHAAEHNTYSSHAYGNRAGLEVDQLWDLIQSFQQLQRSIGARGSTSDGAYRPATSGGSHSHGSRNGGDFSHESGPTASLHGVRVSSANSEIGFDAVSEAFRVYDPRNTHYVEKEVLSRIMAQIGFGELNEEDLALLVGTADFDGDGHISLDDFRRLVNMKGRFKKT
ncbi:hypothetical protein ABL78_4471 [Leptomonas seymouri]|uniref:EF-hand domain-containing protein n=1 Tax=Leptomonas seymouri TaxID=5684 RepID=A0A0N1IK70_LEPSE|nr:hypothetical protein ABL78_4471 [Leptomonas seymouri]|eukprot:KPI86440.1 hypothetical protein ABL78_4471 [Leptomonas seymouri]